MPFGNQRVAFANSPNGQEAGLGGRSVGRVLVPLPPPGSSALSRVARGLTPRVIGSLLVVVLLTGVLAVSAGPRREAPRTAFAVPAAVQQRTALEVAPSPVALPPHALSVLPRRPGAKGAKAKTAAPKKKVVRWLPTGTGMWLHVFDKSEGGSAQAIVARAKTAGLSTLYVQTGSSKKGWIGSPTLNRLLPATKGTGLKVIAWDFPTLRNPEADAARMARAARFHCGGCPKVAAVAPDVETAAEGTRIGENAVARYYTALRRALPADMAILATVPWPSEKRVGKYPYARTAALADAVLPMTYWYNRSPAQVTAASMAYLHRFGKPVMPVGQGYDGRIDAPYLAADPDPFGSVRAFLDTAKARGARHVSLWSWQASGDHQWSALARAHALFAFRPQG